MQEQISDSSRGWNPKTNQKEILEFKNSNRNFKMPFIGLLDWRQPTKEAVSLKIHHGNFPNWNAKEKTFNGTEYPYKYSYKRITYT